MCIRDRHTSDPRPSQARNFELADTDAYPLPVAPGSPWTEEQVPIIGKYINGFHRYARAQPATRSESRLARYHMPS
eukprot:3683163-Prymnesium_polylepis.1